MLINLNTPPTYGNFCFEPGISIKPRIILDYNWLYKQRGKNQEHLLSTRLDGYGNADRHYFSLDRFSSPDFM
jgi:hypothetical protein